MRKHNLCTGSIPNVFNRQDATHLPLTQYLIHWQTCANNTYAIAKVGQVLLQASYRSMHMLGLALQLTCWCLKILKKLKCLRANNCYLTAKSYHLPVKININIVVTNESSLIFELFQFAYVLNQLYHMSLQNTHWYTNY